MTKTCSKCSQELSLENFTIDTRMRSGLRSQCKNCTRLEAAARYKTRSPEEIQKQRDRVKTYAAKSKGKQRQYHLRTKYKLEEHAYEHLLLSQGGGCAICQRKPSGGYRDKHLQVDHSHATHEVRGLLCGPCNRGLGDFKDSTNLIKAAIEYLRAPR